MRKSKHDMHLADGQQFFIAIGEPLIAGIDLALRTMLGTAGVERGGLMAALTTAIQMSAESAMEVSQGMM